MVFPSWFLGDCDICDRRRLCCPDPRSREQLPICGGCLYTREIAEMQSEFEYDALLQRIGDLSEESYGHSYARLSLKELTLAQELAAWQVEQSKLDRGAVGTRAA